MQDLLQECIEDLTPGDRDYKAFEETFCARCRNPTCIHAQWAGDKFAARVAAQPDRMFNPTRVTVTEAPRYAAIIDFTDRLKEALRLEMVDRRGDWEPIPEFELTDGQERVADAASTRAVDDAVASLASARGTPAPQLRDPEEAQEPEEAVEPEETVEPERVPPPPPPPVKPATKKPPPMGNTRVPPGGVILGSGPVPTPSPAPDPWAGPAERPQVVSPGTTIPMGGGAVKVKEKSDG